MLDTRAQAAATPMPKPKLGRRISWQELWKIRPDLRPDNDNQKEQSDAA